MSAMSPAISTLMAAMIDLLRAKAAPLAITDQMIDSIQPLASLVPAELPVLSLLSATLGLASPETAPVTDALIKAAPELPWRQTYNQDDGFEQKYLDTYGWTDLAAPEGPYTADGFRLMLGYWGQGLIYPNHSHPPEEHYMVLAGNAWFRLDDAPYQKLGPGEVFHVPAGAVHSADMRDEGLLAISIWRAKDVRVRINLTQSDRTVAMD